MRPHVLGADVMGNALAETWMRRPIVPIPGRRAMRWSSDPSRSSRSEAMSTDARWPPTPTPRAKAQGATQAAERKERAGYRCEGAGCETEGGFERAGGVCGLCGASQRPRTVASGLIRDGRPGPRWRCGGLAAFEAKSSSLLSVGGAELCDSAGCVSPSSPKLCFVLRCAVGCAEWLCSSAIIPA